MNNTLIVLFVFRFPRHLKQIIYMGLEMKFYFYENNSLFSYKILTATLCTSHNFFMLFVIIC